MAFSNFIRRNGLRNAMAAFAFGALAAASIAAAAPSVADPAQATNPGIGDKGYGSQPGVTGIAPGSGNTGIGIPQHAEGGFKAGSGAFGAFVGPGNNQAGGANGPLTGCSNSGLAGNNSSGHC